MKQLFWVPLVAALWVAPSFSQDKIYRCGNQYTNAVPDAGAQGCKLVEGANVTVVKSSAAPAAPASPAASKPVAAPARQETAAQKARDSEARLVLESELNRAQARQLELLAEYNNGEPEKMGSEARNHQKYLDRVGQIKASLERNERDMAGIARELGRVPAIK